MAVSISPLLAPGLRDDAPMFSIGPLDAPVNGSTLEPYKSWPPAIESRYALNSMSDVAPPPIGSTGSVGFGSDSTGSVGNCEEI